MMVEYGPCGRPISRRVYRIAELLLGAVDEAPLGAGQRPFVVGSCLVTAILIIPVRLTSPMPAFLGLGLQVQLHHKLER